MPTLTGRKVIFSRDEIAAFNNQWPCSELRSTRAYWFEFAENGDLVDTDVPEQDDGHAAAALSCDAWEYLLNGIEPSWLDAA